GALRNLRIWSRCSPICVSLHADFSGWDRCPADRPNQSTTPHGSLDPLSVRGGVRGRGLSGAPLRGYPASDLSAAVPRGGSFGLGGLVTPPDRSMAVVFGGRSYTPLGHPVRPG